jgi:hypothetical protein
MKSIFEAYAKIQETNPAQAGVEAAKRDAQKPYVSLVGGEWILIGSDGKDVKNFGKDKLGAQLALKDLFDEGAYNRLDYAEKNPEEAEAEEVDERFTVVLPSRQSGKSVHGNMIDAKMPSLKKAMHIAADNDEFVKRIASDPVLLKALMAAVAPSPKVDMDVKADIHDLKK